MFILLLPALLYLSVHTQPCQPQFLLTSTLQDTLQLAFTNQQGSSQGHYTYQYSSTFFNNTPTPLISLSGFDVTGFAEINYLLSTSIENKSLVITLQTTNMNWQTATVSLILHSRTDLFSLINTLTVSTPGTTNLSVKSSLATALYTTTFLGIQATYTSAYSFQLQGSKLAAQNCLIAVTSNTPAIFTLQTVYLDPTQAHFAYGYQNFALQPALPTQARTLWMEFAPVIYTLLGFTTLEFSGSNIQLTTTRDLISNLITFNNSVSVSKVGVGVFAIGLSPALVCSPCNNYISISGCLDTCPAASYPEIFSSGGKTCRVCQSKQGQTLNSLSNGCTCPSGTTYFQGNCYSPNSLPPACPPNQLLFGSTCLVSTAPIVTANTSTNTTSQLNCSANSHPNSQGSLCVCNQNYELVKSSCLHICPQHSTRSSSGFCTCSFGYIMNSSKLCESICPLNSIYRQDFQQCVCNYGYQMINGLCSQCPKGQLYDSSTSKCVTAFYSTSTDSSVLSPCQPNQIVVNGSCQCDQNSISLGDRCVPCPHGSYKAGNQCRNCSDYCTNCVNLTDCSQCQNGFNLINAQCSEVCGDGRRFVLFCDDGNTVSGDGCSSACQIEAGYICFGGSPISTDLCQPTNPNDKTLTISVDPGYPIYTTMGIITNFDINPPVARTDDDLRNMFEITFTPQEGRPRKIIISQNEYDPTDVRCVFDYGNHLPNLAFSVQFQIYEPGYGLARVQWQYNTLTNPISSAIMRNLPRRPVN